MATYRRCDRCNKSTEEMRLQIRGVKIIFKDYFEGDKASVDLDYCDNCRAELKKFLGTAGARL